MSTPSWMEDDWSAEEAQSDAQSGDFEAIPAGDYEVEVISVEERKIDNANATGLGVNIQLAVRGEAYDNRRLFEWFNVLYQSKLENADKKEKAKTTQRIGRGQFGALCVALGISKRPGSYDELIGKFCRASVGKRLDTYKDDGSHENYIKAYQESAEFANPSRPAAASGGNPWG